MASFGVRVRVSKVLGSNYNRNPNPTITITITLD